MQLDDEEKVMIQKIKKITPMLGIATATLLGSVPSISTASSIAEEKDWSIDTAALFYSESDSRVIAIEPVISAKRVFDDDRILSLKFALDSLTGASPIGALPSDEIQTFTRPSGKGDFITDANTFPTDDTFRDTRVALSANWSQPLTDTRTGSVGFSFSNEFDFRSLGLSFGFSQDLYQNNTTLNVGLNFESDLISPIGGIPAAYGAMQPKNASLVRDGADDSKTVIDVLVGFTQVLSRRSLLQFNYSRSESNGYLTDPFKIISVVDANGDVASNDRYLYEVRPDSRSKQSLFVRLKHIFNPDIVDISYRYMWDDWDIKSHTIDARYRWYLSELQYIEPHVRYYRQDAADFYTPLLLGSDVSNATLPEFASADIRLAKFTGVTVGAKFARRLTSSSELSFKLEIYRQSGESTPSALFGGNSDKDVFPDLTAFMAQVGYSFKW